MIKTKKDVALFFAPSLKGNPGALEVVARAIAPKLRELVNHVPRDFTEICGDIYDNDLRKNFQHCYFKSLLLELVDHKALHDSLHIEVELYFTAKTIDHAAFQARCTSIISTHRQLGNLKKHEPLAHLLLKWLLALATVGTVLLGSLIKSKIETGQYKLRFFETPAERSCDKIEQALADASYV